MISMQAVAILAVVAVRRIGKMKKQLPIQEFDIHLESLKLVHDEKKRLFTINETLKLVENGMLEAYRIGHNNSIHEIINKLQIAASQATQMALEANKNNEILYVKDLIERLKHFNSNLKIYWCHEDWQFVNKIEISSDENSVYIGTENIYKK
jgi:hypothetical protein